MSKANRPTTHARHPSNARRRRERHLERATAIKTRKHERVYRGRIHAAMLEAAQLVELSSIPHIVTGTFHAPDVKVAGEGWEILNKRGEVAFYSSSRDKARAAARSATESGYRVSATPLTHDQAMLQLGWQRTDVERGPVEEKFEWAGAA